MEGKEAILKLNYIFDNIKPSFSEIIIENKKYNLEDVNNKEIKIKFNDIESEICSKIVELQLIFKKRQPIHKFEVIPGINYGILLPSMGLTRDFIFPENETYMVNISPTDSDENKVINLTNNRLLFINISISYNLEINNKLLSRKEIISSNELSLQIFVADLLKGIFFHKKISSVNYNSFFDSYKNDKLRAKNFLQEIQDLLKDNKFNDSEYLKIHSKGYLSNVLLAKFNLPKKILQDKYNNKEYFEYISSCCLYFILPHEKDREKEIRNIYNYFFEFKKKLEVDTNLENYMRIKIIIEFSLLFEKNRNFELFKSFKYYTIKQSEKDSPLYNAIAFLNDFIDNLDEKSPFIYPLVLIDSGNYIYGQENAYGQGLTNQKILKSHLKNIMPDILLFIEDENNKFEQAFTNKSLGIVVLNLASKILSPLKNIDLDKCCQNRDINIKLSLILFLTLFHEILGHKKGGYSSKGDDGSNILLSPNVFYDRKKKEILKLVNRDTKYASKNEIKIIRDDDKDAGYFLEYFIGECEYGFYSELIDKMLLENINLNFIFDINLWHTKIEIMRNYIRLKYIVFKYNKNLLNTKKYSNIDEELKDLDAIIKEKDIKINIMKEIPNQNNEINIEERKRKELSDSEIKQKEFERYENLSSSEIKKKMNDEETPYELKQILFKILLNRVIRK